MFNPLKLKCTSVVGIDINQYGVKLIEISSQKEMHCIEGFFQSSIPHGALEGHAIKNTHRVSEGIKRAIDHGHIHSKQAVVAVPDSAVLTKVISIHAGLSTREIEEYIRMASENDIAYPSHEINVDFQIIGPSKQHFSMQEVRVFMARTEQVNERVEAVNCAGLEVKVVDIESHARIRAVQLLAKQWVLDNQTKGKLDTVVAIIVIDALELRLFIFQGVNLIFTREEAFDISQLIPEFSQGHLSALVCNPLAEESESKDLKPFMEGVLLQMKRMLHFFFSTDQNQPIDEIMFAGELAQAPGLKAFIQEKTNLATRIASPVYSLSVNQNLDYPLLSQTGLSMMLACGLALHRLN